MHNKYTKSYSRTRMAFFDFYSIIIKKVSYFDNNMAFKAIPHPKKNYTFIESTRFKYLNTKLCQNQNHFTIKQKHPLKIGF